MVSRLGADLCGTSSEPQNYVGKHSSGAIYEAFWDLGQILKIRDCPGHSGTVEAYASVQQPCLKKANMFDHK